MLVKGLISSVNEEEGTAEVILLEYENVVTRFLPFYNRTKLSKLEVPFLVGKLVTVAIFNNDFNDGIILDNPSLVNMPIKATLLTVNEDCTATASLDEYGIETPLLKICNRDAPLSSTDLSNLKGKKCAVLVFNDCIDNAIIVA